MYVVSQCHITDHLSGYPTTQHSLTVEAAFFENFHLLLRLEPERGDAVEPVLRHDATEEGEVGRAAPG